jgi:hypothetical protein
LVYDGQRGEASVLTKTLRKGGVAAPFDPLRRGLKGWRWLGSKTMVREWSDSEKVLIAALENESERGVKLSSQTIASYENLYRMLTAATGKDLGKSIAQAAASQRKIQKTYPLISTKKSIVTAVNGLLTRKQDVANEKAVTKWRQYQTTLRQLYSGIRDNNVETPALMEKMIDLDAVRAKAKDLAKKEFKNVKESMRHLVLLMMVDMPPKRADFGELRVHERMPHDKNVGNYVIVPEKGDVRLVLNEFKTAKSHFPIDENLPKTVADALRKSLADFPRDYVFVGRFPAGNIERMLPMTPDAYGKFVKTTFELYMGKKAGITALRRAYITQTCDPKTMTMEQLKEIAKSMGHTTTEQARYNVVTKAKK